MQDHCSGSCATYSTNTFNESIGTSYVAGQYSTDTFTFDLAEPALSFPRLQFANYTSEDATELSGSVGLGWPTNQASFRAQSQSGYPTFIKALVTQGSINGYSYSFWTDTSDGDTAQLLLGGIDQTAYTGTLMTLNTTVQDLGTLDGTQPVMQLSTMAFMKGQQSVSTANRIDIIAVQAANTLLDESIVQPVWDELGVMYNHTKDNVDQLPLVPCDWSTNTTYTFDFTFVQGLSFSIPLGDLIDAEHEVPDESGMCYLKFGKANTDWYGRLGPDIWKHIYKVVDFDNKQVSMALNSFNATKKTFTEIPSAGVSAIFTSTPTPTPTPSPTPAPTGINKLALGVGLGVGIPVALILLGLAIFFIRRSKKKRNNTTHETTTQHLPPVTDASTKTNSHYYIRDDNNNMVQTYNLPQDVKHPFTANSTAVNSPNLVQSPTMSGIYTPQTYSNSHNTASVIQQTPVYHEMPGTVAHPSVTSGFGSPPIVPNDRASSPEMSPAPRYSDMGWNHQS